ncbi:MAG: sigma 54-interacting transcriptional regulator [Verrucomicrobiota bacterium]
MSANNLPNFLIVEDEHALSLALAAAVRQVNARAEVVPTASLARQQLLNEGRFTAMILDIGLPDENGLRFLENLPEDKRLPTLVVTAHGEIENTINARKLGVRDFLTKPLDFDAFKESLTRLLKSAPSDDAEPKNSPAFVGGAAAMRPVFQQIAHACASSDPVLIRGETGTGKSHVARLIHQNSAPQNSPFVVYAGGGAIGDHLARAKGGVLVIDDVARLDLNAQAELLRSWESSKTDMPRILGASNADLRAAVESGGIRGELFYRLQVLEIRLPPLRERLEDLPSLLSFFLGQLEPNRPIAVDDESLRLLMAHDWPGNLRELRNVASLAMTVSGGASVIDASHLPEHLRSEANDVLESSLDSALDDWLDERLTAEVGPAYRDLSEELERQLLRQLLKRFDGKLARLARELKANRSTLRKKLNGS